ncbi:hypothetical protein OsJ_35467 [Oryza sativa Japonica Group]|uniref:Uncharacterized protein n=1 Tax=Oryza sativa subsp. japonica TaxID=39947 RepID=B9GC80_ORYSJ|nr:hypothetical protein OsJ_35467 [Oryza sativa Japonica Group]
MGMLPSLLFWLPIPPVMLGLEEAAALRKLKEIGGAGDGEGWMNSPAIGVAHQGVNVNRNGGVIEAECLVEWAGWEARTIVRAAPP